MDRSEAAGAKSFAQAVSPELEEGAQNITEDGAHCADADDSAAEEEPQQNRLDLIVAMMAYGDPGGAEPGAAAAQEGVAFSPRRRLHTFASQAALGDLQPLGRERYAELLGDPSGVSRSLCRRRVEDVIEMGGADCELVAACELVQSPEQDGRIGTAGETDENLPAGQERSVEVQEALDMVNERLAQCPFRCSYPAASRCRREWWR